MLQATFPATGLLALGLCLAVAGGATAEAAEPKLSANARKIVVLDLTELEDRANEEIRRAAEDAARSFTNRDGLRVYDLRDVHGSLNAGGEENARRSITTAAGFVDAGNAAMAADDYEDAIEQFVSARRMYESALAVMDSLDPYVQTLMYLGEARLRGGAEDGAREAFQRAAALGASAEGFDEQVQAAFREAKAAEAALPLGAVQINTVPPYAEIYIDGDFKGMSPLTAAGLKAGAHVVMVKKPGYERVTQAVTVSSERMEHRDISLSEARRKLLFDDVKRKVAAEIAAAGGEEPVGGPGVEDLGTLFRSETALTIQISGTSEEKDVTFALFHVPTKRLVKRVDARGIDWAYKNTAAIERAVHDVLDVNWGEVLGGEQETVTTEDGGVLSEWWFWTGVVVVVAGGTTAAILLSQDDETGPAFSRDGAGAIVLGF